MSNRHTDFYIGLMSGTSLDAIDVALVSFDGNEPPRLVAATNHLIPVAVRAEAENLCQPGPDEINRMGQLDRRFGVLFAEATMALLAETGYQASQICAIGSHGQTIRHHPSKSPAFTLQIGDPNTIACLTGITTVADFRRMDIAAGGEGAPLVPAFHNAVLRSATENRVVVNIGGMANISVLARELPLSGFDTGPGNILMDSWIQQKHQRAYDKDGAWAASGHCDVSLLDQLLAHPYILSPPPKSTGREIFHLDWLTTVLAAFPSLPDEDVQRTLLEFTARSITQAIEDLPITVDHVLLCGGGSHNTLLRERIAALLPGRRVGKTSDVGVDADWVEAMAFAWLARQRIAMKPGNVPAVTGASRPCILGGVYLPDCVR